MTPQNLPTESSTGDSLMGLVAAAVIFIVAVEAAFVFFASWLLLPLVMLGVIAAAGVVVFALARAMDDDKPVPQEVLHGNT
jgi:hypothetical protein